MKNVIQPFSSQRGMVLVVGMLFLLILTILGISSMNASVISEKMSQNIRDATTAFNAAESALTDGEQWVQNQVTAPTPVSSCSSAPCYVWTLGSVGTPYQQSASWWQTNGINYSSTIGGVYSQPQYVIEQYSFVAYDLSTNALSSGHGYYYYRISSRGIGMTANALVNLQSIYCTQYN